MRVGSRLTVGRLGQERLGNANIAITLDIYSHVNPVLAADAANTVANVIVEHRRSAD